MERRDCMKRWLISTNYKRRLVDNEFTRPAFILNAQAVQSFPPTLACSWGNCWAFGSSQGLIWRITPFKRSIGIIPHFNTQTNSKTVLSFIWNILKLKTWILSGWLSQNISWTDPFQCFVFLCGHSSKGSLYLSNGISSAFSFYHFSQSLAISSSSM